jgi:hypothetical protein
VTAGFVVFGNGSPRTRADCALAQSSKRAPADLMNAAFEPVRTPFDWLSRDPAVVDAFLKDPLYFGWLKPAATASFFAAEPRLADPGSAGSDWALSRRRCLQYLPRFLSGVGGTKRRTKSTARKSA